MAMLLSSCSMPELTRVSTQQFPQPQSCGECHVEIFNEWRSSPHAGAFVNERFSAATDGHRFGQCLGCHAPAAQMVKAEPEARLSDRELGVVCVACHLDHGAMVGPLPPTGMVKPHPIRVDPAPFADGALCGQCHQGTRQQWLASRKDASHDCRDCHMPPVIRKTTQATSTVSEFFVAAEKTAHEHRHSFLLTPADLRDPAVSLDCDIAGRSATITLTNHLPHNLPTGDFGVRIIDIAVEAVDGGGTTTSLGRWQLTNAGNGALASGASRAWTVRLPVGARKLRVSITRHGRDGAERATLLRKEVALP